MAPRNVILWALLPVIVVLAMSAGVQAKELREVPASEILKNIQAGEDVYLENVRITGKLNLGGIELETVPIAREEFEIDVWGLEKELNIVESKITIINSVFGSVTDFSNMQFKKPVDFRGTSFLYISDFGGARFGGDANFGSASFDGAVGFRSASFDGVADFSRASFGGNAYFLSASFDGVADFRSASFGGSADFRNASFDSDADFSRASFGGNAYFLSASFGGNAYFRSASFGGSADFRNASFDGVADFSRASFDSDANFRSARFGGFANFRSARFGGFANFGSARFGGDANFGSARFGGFANFGSTEFNKVSFYNTTFIKVSFYEADFKSMKVEWASLKDALFFEGPTYIKLIKNFREMEQFKDGDDAYYQYRRLGQADKKWSFPKLGDIFMWLSCGYGVKPQYTIILAAVMILIFTIICWLGNGIRRLKERDEDDTEDVSFFDAFYFSVVTFTTVGYGDWYPKDRYRKFVMIEGLVGWLILALFLVTLANVMIRP
jgi:hypothetical protein